MKALNIAVVAIVLNIMISGCAAVTSMYPKTLDQNPVIEKDTSIVLFGIKGKRKVNYVQFYSYGSTAVNYYFNPASNKVLALRVPTPKTGFCFSVFTAGPAGYTASGASFGYISVNSESIDIKQQGIYYYGVLDTDLLLIDQDKDIYFLNRAQRKYGHLLKNLKPINFQW